MIEKYLYPVFWRCMTMLLLCAVFIAFPVVAQTEAAKKVLIVVEGETDLKNPGLGVGRQLQALLGHFLFR
jgi:hypothetical protein